jgi:acyl-coenzyme A synthetase/AMP-(fatty) acid ligase
MYPGTWARTTPDKPALVMAGSGAVTTYAELEERSARLARHLEVPRELIVTDDLPRTPTDKLVRGSLKTRFAVQAVG